jgi:hypothetical protein
VNLKLAGAVAASTLCVVVSAAVAGGASGPVLYSNCSHLNAKYPHGVGLVGARDHTKSGKNGVTTFQRNNRIYKLATHYNADLDRDRDNVACEQ